MTSPVLLVLLPGGSARWEAPISEVGVPTLPVTGHEAIHAVRQSSARWIAFERVPGWQAVARGVFDAGGRPVLLGDPPTPAERRWLDGVRVDAIRRPVSLLELFEADAAQPSSAARSMSHGPSTSDAGLAAEPAGRAGSAGDPRAAGGARDAQVRVEQLSRFAESITAQPDLDSLGQEICARIREACDADQAILFLVDPDSGALEPEAPYRHAADREHRKLAEEIARSAITWSGACGNRPAAGIPLLRSGDVVGVLEVFRRAGRAPFSPANLSFLGHSAGPISAALQAASAHQRLKEAQAQILADNAALERKVGERTEMIARAKREWEQTFDSIREPIAVQEGFVIRRANLAYAARAGVPIREVPGQTCHRLLAGRETPCPGCPLAAGLLTPGEVPIRAAQFVVSPFRRGATPEDTWVVVHYRDITEQRRLQQRLFESERMASLGQLASGAAHEINNPLGFVISNLKNLRTEHQEIARLLEAIGALRALARRDPAAAGEKLAALEWEVAPADLIDMVDESLAGASRVAAIVKGLRDLSRLEIGALEPAQIAASVSRAIHAEFGDCPSAVESELTAATRASIPPLQLDQVLQHLLRNARQAIAPPAAAGQRVRVRSWDEPDRVVIEVSDDGCGIPPEHLPRIFEPFFTTRGVGQGVGLGLTSAYGIVQRHGGTIEAHSEVARGATFTLRLPREAAPSAIADRSLH